MNIPLEAYRLITEFSQEYCFCVILDQQVIQLSQAMINTLGPEYANLHTCSGLQNIVQATQPLIHQSTPQDALIPFQQTFFINSLAFASTGIQRLPTSACIYFVYFTPVLNTMPLPQKHLSHQDRHILQKRLYEISILQALDELRASQFQGLELYFQPRLDSVTHEFHSLELLIRWKNKEFGFIPPMDFIPIAERSGHIHLLGRWILDQVINLQAQLVRQGLFIRTSFNISALQLNQNFVTEIIDKVKASGLEPFLFEVELTETALLEDQKTSRQLIYHLRRAGLKVALDDFGTGYSSILYLTKIKFDYVKLDRSLLVMVDQESSKFSMLKAIVNMIRAVNAKVVVEGIENLDHHHIAKFLEADELQGYHYAKPQPLANLVKFIESQKSLTF